MTHQKLFDHMSQEKKFIEWCKLERSTFAKKMWENFNWENKPVDERVCIENILIPFDQLLDKQKRVESKISELKTNLETARIAHNCAAGIAKKNIAISLTSIEYAISVLKELVE